MEKEVAERLEKLRYMQEELGLDVPEGVTVEEDEKGFQALQSKILNQISDVKDVISFFECVLFDSLLKSETNSQSVVRTDGR